MGCAVRHYPAISFFQLDRLSFQMQSGAALQHEPYHLVISAGLRFRFAGRLVFPKSHGDMDAGREILLSVRSSRRISGLHLLY